MISKFVNLGWTRNGVSANTSVEEKHLNRLDDLAYISPYNPSGAFSTDFLTNYPKSNIHELKTYKEARLNTFQNGPTYFAGISVELDSGFGNWNTLALQFNKLNTDLVNKLRSLNVQVQWERIDSPGTIDYTVTLNASTTIENTFPSLVSTGKIYPEEGLILIDKDITKAFAEQSFDESEYKINVIFSSSTDFEYFSISNLTFTDSIDIFIDDEVSFERENLNEYSNNSRTGSTFVQLNSEMKMLKTAISLLDKTEKKSFDKNVVRFNKNTPFFFFPYCESSENSDFEYSLFNLEAGGLYNFDNKWKFDNDDYNIFDLNIKLEEHK